MNVIIKIEGREAIPVRAIPLLTDWCTVTPDILALALSGDENLFWFAAMQAYRVVSGKAVPRRWWTENAVRPLRALSDRIRATQITHETGLREFHAMSLKELPAGVYVWRDEFERVHQRRYGRATLPLDFEDKDVQLTDAESATLTAEHQERIALDYAPFINDELRTLVLEGFLPGAELSPEPPLMQSAATPAPVAVIDGPAPLTTSDIAYCFAGLRWSEPEWKKPLGDKPKWLSECVSIPARRGVSETRWNPVLIGAALVQKGHATPRNLRAKFQTIGILNPWLDEWKTYEADYCSNN